MRTSAPSVHRASAAALVALLCAGAIVLRLHGIGFTLPHIPEQDGLMLPSQVAHVRAANGAIASDDNWARYPHLIAYVAAMRPAPPALAPHDAPLAEHLEAASAPFALVRTTVAWLSVLMVPATWLLARRFMGELAALLAAAWIATSVLHVWYSQVASPHGPAAATALLAVIAALYVCRTGTLFAYALAGVAAAVAICTLQNGIFVLPPLLAAHFLRPRSVRSRGVAYLAIGVAIVGLGYVLLYPAASGEGSGPVGPMFQFTGKTIEFFGHTVFLEMFNGQGFVSVLRTLWNLQPLMSVLAAFAIGAWLVNHADRLRPSRWRANAELVVVLAYVIPYLLVIGSYQRTYDRFVLQLLPYVACAAASGVERAFTKLPRAALSPALALLVAIPLWDSVQLVKLRAAPDTATSAARWIEGHLDPSADHILLVPFLDLPLLRNKDALANDRNVAVSTPWRDYQHALGGAPASAKSFGLYSMPIGNTDVRTALERDPIAHMRSLGVQYGALARPEPSKMPEFFRSIHRALESGAELVHRSPEGGATQAFDGVVDGGLVPWTWRSLHAFTQVGTVIEVYRLR